MADTTQQDLINQQDQLRSVRQFVSLLAGATGQDQTLSGTDFAAVNAPGQFSSVGPYGTAVEGQPIISYSKAQGMTIAPAVVLVGLGLAAWFMLK